MNKIVTGAIFGGISLVAGAAIFLESRIISLGTKIDDNTQKMMEKIDDNTQKMTENSQKMMEVFMAMSNDIAFLKGAITNSKKK